MEINERILILRKALKLTQAEFGDRIGVARNTVANYESGTRVPMEGTLKSICRVYNVDYLWLTTGEGDMFTDLPETLLDELVLEYNLDEQDRRILKAYLELDASQREVFKTYMKSAFPKNG